MPYKDREKQLEAQREHYRNNREVYVGRTRAKNRRIRDYVNSKKDIPCTDCGIKYPYYVMQFDHLGDKEYGINWIIRNGSYEAIDKEIAKCEVVCANCHAVRTYLRSKRAFVA